MKDFFIEIGTEELPARHCESIKKQLTKDYVSKVASECGLQMSEPHIYVTPRRIVITASSIDFEKTSSNIKGPLYDIAFEDGEPNNVAKKFAASNNKEVSDIEIKTIKGKRFLFLKSEVSLNSIDDKISSLVIKLIKQLNFDRKMTWDSSGTKFSRPIRSLTCCTDKQPVKLKSFGIESSNVISLSRFHEQSSITVNSYSEYFDMLKSHGIILDSGQRKSIISDFVKKQELSELIPAGDIDPLITELTFLVESPLPVLCEFDSKYLELPEKVIEAVLVKHQRYIPLYSKQTRKITNKFIVIANQTNISEEIKKGNQRVITARLADAKFFYDADSTHELEYFNNFLEDMIFQEELGTVKDLVDRVTNSVSEILDSLDLGVNKKDVLLASRLSKADLSTKLVAEFSSLEGHIGEVLAQKAGLSSDVARVLSDYYKPRHSRDSLPSTKVGVLLSLLYNLHKLYGFFSVGLIPSGRSDPYALRRSAIAISRLLWESDLRVDQDILFNSVESSYSKYVDREVVVAFILDKLEEYLRTKYPSLEVNILRAIIKSAINDYQLKKQTLEFFTSAANSELKESFIHFFKRVFNMTKGVKEQNSNSLKKSDLNESESSFLNDIHTVDTGKANIIDLRKVVKSGDIFFEENLILSDVPEEKARRLAILMKARELIEKYLDLEALLS